jgi:hypothetical protein
LLSNLLAAQALEAARKLLRQREAQLAEAAAERDAAAGERGQLEQQMQAGREAIEGEAAAGTQQLVL